MNNTFIDLSNFKLTKGQRKSFNIFVEFVQKWRNLLHLDPSISIEISPAVLNCHAQVEFGCAQYHIYNIKINKGFLSKHQSLNKYSLNTIETVVIHELLHIFLYPYTSHCELGAKKILKESLPKKEEEIVERLTWTFASFIGIEKNRITGLNINLKEK